MIFMIPQTNFSISVRDGNPLPLLPIVHGNHRKSGRWSVNPETPPAIDLLRNEISSDVPTEVNKKRNSESSEDSKHEPKRIKVQQETDQDVEDVMSIINSVDVEGLSKSHPISISTPRKPSIALTVPQKDLTDLAIVVGFGVQAIHEPRELIEIFQEYPKAFEELFRMWMRNPELQAISTRQEQLRGISLVLIEELFKKNDVGQREKLIKYIKEIFQELTLPFNCVCLDVANHLRNDPLDRKAIKHGCDLAKRLMLEADTISDLWIKERFYGCVVDLINHFELPLIGLGVQVETVLEEFSMFSDLRDRLAVFDFDGDESPYRTCYDLLDNFPLFDPD